MLNRLRNCSRTTATNEDQSLVVVVRDNAVEIFPRKLRPAYRESLKTGTYPYS